MRPLLTTLLIASILINVVLGAVKSDAADATAANQITYENPYPTYVPSFLR